MLSLYMSKKLDSINKNGYAKSTKENSTEEIKSKFGIFKYFGFKVAKMAHVYLLHAMLNIFKIYNDKSAFSYLIYDDCGIYNENFAKH